MTYGVHRMALPLLIQKAKEIAMKTIKSQILLLTVLALSVFTTACGKKDGNNNANYHNQGRYIMSGNGQCVDRQTYQPVAQQYCVNTANTHYQWNGNQCIDTRTQQPVAQNYCQTTGGTNSQYQMTQWGCIDTTTNQPVPQTFCTASYPTPNGNSQCYGSYYYMDPYYGQPVSVYCQGHNCSGYQLYSYQTGYPVNCQ